MTFTEPVSSGEEINSTKRLKTVFTGLMHAMWTVRWTGIVCILTFATTLTTFPSMFMLVVPQNMDQKGVWESKLPFESI